MGQRHYCFKFGRWHTHNIDYTSKNNMRAYKKGNMMKTNYFLILSVFFVTIAPAGTVNFNPTLLPESFAVYTNNNTVINNPAPGFSKQLLPTNNDYQGTPGCYILCYSHQEMGSSYPVSSTIYVMGQIRVPGNYIGRLCEPTQFKGKDISAEPLLKTLCDKTIKSCKGNSCWAGGDSGGWFGIQPAL